MLKFSDDKNFSCRKFNKELITLNDKFIEN